MTIEERLTALELAVAQLAQNKIDRVSVNELRQMDIARFTDLHSTLVSHEQKISTILGYIINNLTGNTA